MAFSRKTTRYYSDEEDLRGGLRKLSDLMADFEARQTEGEPTKQAEIYDFYMNYGAACVIECMLMTDLIENCERFIKLFDAKKKGNDYGI